MKNIIKILFFFIIFSVILFAQQQISKKGIELIKYYEGFRSSAYLCPAGVLTIGFGHTGSNVKKGLVITKYQAEILLYKDLYDFERYVNKSVYRILLINEFDALVDFSYNVGYRINDGLQDAINSNNIKLINYMISSYNKIKKGDSYIILSQLKNRRKSEMLLYEKDSLWIK